MFRFRSVLLLSLAILQFRAGAQIPGRNVNMVSGTTWPDGDPFLQRQNEPSMAVSSRNPSHLLAGSNDYRTVDLPGLPDAETGDAWLGIFKSYDGGQTWRSTVHPGCPQKVTACDGAPALKAYSAGADPVVRAGTSGMFYYSGIAFTRDTPKKSTVFVSRFIDNNNEENGDPIKYINTVPVAVGSGAVFVDKPWIAVDIPRAGAATCQVSVPQKNGNPLTQSFPAGNVYLAYTTFTDESKPPSQILFARSTDCGATWSKPITVADNSLNQGAALTVDPSTGAVYMAWRRFQSDGFTDAIMFAKSTDGGQTFGTPQQVASITPFDQGTTLFSFRTNAYPAIAVDAASRIYLAWSERNTGAPASGGDARIVIATSRDGANWTQRVPVNDYAGRGHQLMPAMTFGGGKLMLIFYDVRLDNTVGNYTSPGGGQYPETRVPAGDLATVPPHPEKVFTNFLLDAAPASLNLGGLLRRHTIDVYAAQADPADVPSFTLSRVSQYIFGSRQSSKIIEQLQVNPPNLPLFKQGSAPFMGDYLDVAASPSFLPGDTPGTWKFNTDATRATTFHAVWTDNRDVRPPANGDWTDYTPPISSATSGLSLFDPTQAQPACRTGQAGMRNQNIYTSRISQGLLVTSPSNAKVLGVIQRSFPVNVANATSRTRTYRLTIVNQPAGGKASFLQVPVAGLPDPLTTLDVNVSPASTISRMVFVRSTDPAATIRVNVDEVSGVGASALLAGGLAGEIVLNPDPANPANPDIANAELFNPDIANPDIANPDIANPDIANPDIANPDIANPDIANPDIANPDIANPDIANPDIANPDIANPDIANPDIANGAISDVDWKLTNKGNSTATYSVEFLINGVIPAGVKYQLVVFKSYATPVENGCSLVQQPQNVVISSIAAPTILSAQNADILRNIIVSRTHLRISRMILDNRAAVSDITDDSLNNTTVSVGPGETVYVTLRFFNPDKTKPLGFDPGQAITTVSISHSINTGDTQPAVAASHLLLASTSLAAGVAGAPYDELLVAAGGKTPYKWSISQGALPPGLTLNPATGEIKGTIDPAASDIYNFTVQVMDSSSPPGVQTQALSILVSRVSLAIGGLAASGANGVSVKPGDTITVTATVTNSGSAADSVIPGLTVNATGTATAQCGPPTPASASLPTGVQRTFVFTCTNVGGSGTLTFSVTITAVDHGTGANITVSPASSNAVSVLGKAPTITVSATAGGKPYTPGVWTNQSVVVSFKCTPAAGDPVVKTVTVVSEGANQTVSSSCTDPSGQQVSGSFTGIYIDKTAPVITASATAGGITYAGGTTSQTVTVTFLCSDPGGSGPTVPQTQQFFSSDGLGQVATGSCSDIAGNTSTTTYSPINIVKTPPQLHVVLQAGGGTYVPGTWTNQNVGVQFQCTPAPGVTLQSLTPATQVTTEGGNQFLTGTCSDVAGNIASIQAGPINIDRTPPVITLGNRPAANANGWNNSDVTITWNCADQLSGPRQPTVSRTLSTDGANQSVTGTCIDVAGNTASASVTVNLDKTAPQITGQPTPAVPAGGWYNGPVSVAFTCTDALSGIASGSPQGNTTLTADTAGASVNGTCTDQAGNTATATVGPIRIDTAPPVITLSNRPAANANGWYNSDVTITWTCADQASGPRQASVSRTVSTEGANQSVAGTCTDVAGNTASASVTVSLDKTPPQISGQATPAVPASGWYNGPVSVAFACTDSLSGVAAGSTKGATTLSADTAGASVSGSCTDLAGNTASATVGPIRIDTTPPVLQLQSISPAANGAGWVNGPATITWSCTDSGSGTATPTVTRNLAASGSATATCTDVAGNTATSAPVTVNIDTAPPVITLVSPANGFTYPVGAVVRANYSCSDGLSGIASCSGTLPVGTLIPTGTPGTFSFTVTAVDVAGNQAQVTRTYTIATP
jgi:hypothetical protein